LGGITLAYKVKDPLDAQQKLFEPVQDTIRKGLPIDRREKALITSKNGIELEIRNGYPLDKYFVTASAGILPERGTMNNKAFISISLFPKIDSDGKREITQMIKLGPEQLDLFISDLIQVSMTLRTLEKMPTYDKEQQLRGIVERALSQWKGFYFKVKNIGGRP
jgi:hypothetical protein